LERQQVARSGNGVDIGAVYQLLVGVSGRFDDMSGRLDDISGRLDSHDRKLDYLAVGLADLRSAVTNYHSTVLGHGVLISELERVPRIERHLKLESTGN
jgi:hypothetical protein